MDKFEFRRMRLIKIRDEQFGGKPTPLAKRIGKDPSYVTRLFYPEGKEGKKRISDELIEAIGREFPDWLNIIDNNANRIDLETNVAAQQTTLEQEIDALLKKATPRSQEDMKKIAIAASEGRLSEDDLALLRRIAEKFSQKG